MEVLTTEDITEFKKKKKAHDRGVECTKVHLKVQQLLPTYAFLMLLEKHMENN